MFERLITLIGEDNVNKLKKANVWEEGVAVRPTILAVSKYSRTFRHFP